MAEEEIAVRLSLRDRLRFSREAQIAARDVDNIGDQAAQANAKLGILGRGARSLGRVGLAGLKYGALGAGAALATAGVMGVNAASDLGESVNKTKVIFEDAAKSQIRWSKKAAEGFGMTQQEALEGAANLGGLFQAAGETNKSAANLGQGMVELAADMGSFHNVANDEVLMALRSGLTGESEPLRRFGIFLNEAKVQAEGLALGLVKEGQAMTDEQKIMARQSIIMRESEKAHGDFAETVKTSFPNTVKQIKAIGTDALASIGQGLMPVLLDVAKVAKKTVGPLMEAIGPPLEKVTGALGEVLPPLLKAAIPIVNTFADVFVLLAESMGPILPVISEIAQQVFTALKPALEPLAGALGRAFVTVFHALAPVLPDLATAFADLVIALVPLLPIAAKLIGLLLELGVPVIKTVARGVTWLAQNVLTPLVGTVGVVINTMGEGIRWIKDHWNGIVDFFKGIPGKLADIGSGMWDWIKDSFRGAINWVIRGWNGLDFSFDVPDWLPGVPNEVTIGVPDIPELGYGGRITRGGAVVVGDRGPEVAVLPPAASVIPLPVGRGDDDTPLGWPEKIQLVVGERVLAEVTLDGLRNKAARK